MTATTNLFETTAWDEEVEKEAATELSQGYKLIVGAGEEALVVFDPRHKPIKTEVYWSQKFNTYLKYDKKKHKQERNQNQFEFLVWQKIGETLIPRVFELIGRPAGMCMSEVKPNQSKFISIRKEAVQRGEKTSNQWKFEAQEQVPDQIQNFIVENSVKDKHPYHPEVCPERLEEDVPF